MATFECGRCGKCCMSFGAFITIERQLNDRDYYCRYGITGELFLAHTQPEYADEISKNFSGSSGHSAGTKQKKCPFLQSNQNGTGFACAIYPTRPPVCREFRCYRMLIYNRKGEERGKVIGHNGIRTTDPALAQFWKEKVSQIHHAHSSLASDPEWVGKVLAVLAAHGYRGDPVE